jgi:hypothetical protein
MKIIKCARCGNEIYRLDNDWCTSCLVEAGEPVPIAPQSLCVDIMDVVNRCSVTMNTVIIMRK